MSGHVDELLWELALDSLADGERKAAEQHLAGCASCSESLDEVSRLVAAVGWSEAPLTATAEMRARLMAALGDSPLDSLLAPLAAFFDFAHDRARALIDSLAGPSLWEDGPLPGLQVAHVEAGPARAGAYTGLVRMAAGLQFPRHRHVGQERMLVLAGGLRQNDGREVHAGQELVSAPGSAHDFVVIGDEPCLAAVIQVAGIEF